MAGDTLSNRLSDLQSSAYYSAGAFDNMTGGIWEKFSSGGKATIVKSVIPAGFPINSKIVKPSDTPAADQSAQRALFDRTDQETAYTDAIATSKSSAIVIRAKRQSDMLSSMLQAVNMRHSSRLRHTGAAFSRRASLAQYDIEQMAMDMNT